MALRALEHVGYQCFVGVIGQLNIGSLGGAGVGVFAGGDTVGGVW